MRCDFACCTLLFRTFVASYRQTHCQVLGFDAGVVAWDLVLNQIWPEITESQMVDYNSFMSNYIDQEVETKSVYGSANQQSMINVFNSLDADHGGLVSRQEWIDGCSHMNNKLGDAQ